MPLKYPLVAAMVLAFATPALAAEFYIVRGADKKCVVVEQKPTTTETVIVGNKVYTTKTEAEADIKVVCKDAM
jgi:hypothetical protein